MSPEAYPYTTYMSTLIYIHYITIGLRLWLQLIHKKALFMFIYIHLDKFEFVNISLSMIRYIVQRIYVVKLQYSTIA